MSKWARSYVATSLVVLWLLAGCAGGAVPTATPAPSPSPALAERDLRFETIERHESQYYLFHPTEPPHTFLITSAEEASRLAGWVSPTAQQALVQLDYRRYFVIALFRGNFSSSGYDAIIQRVARQDDGLVVHVQFWAPSPYYAVTAASSQPYHMIRVLRDGGSLQETNLVLESQTVTPTPPSVIRPLTPAP